MANLLVTLMDKLDVPVERLGGSTGKLPLDTLSGVCSQAMTTLPRLVPVGLAIFLMGAGGDRPALIDAAKDGDRDALRALIRKKADVNAAEGDGSTALHWASYRDDLESADLLIRAGAKVNAANDLGVTPLWAASQNGSSAMVRRLLEAGAEPELGAAGGRDAADGGRAVGLSRRRRTTVGQGRERERARRARPDRADVGGSRRSTPKW